VRIGELPHEALDIAWSRERSWIVSLRREIKVDLALITESR